MLVFRICKKEYIEDLTGSGAALYGGRWNSKGINMLYTAGNISLAYIEFFIHNYHILKTTNVCLARIKIPENAPIQQFSLIKNPEEFNISISDSFETRKTGDNFIKDKKFYALRVPSAIVPGEFNILLNPIHPTHNETKIIDIIDPLQYDARLFQQHKERQI